MKIIQLFYLKIIISLILYQNLIYKFLIKNNNNSK